MTALHTKLGRQVGFTLVELMIALVVSLLLIAGVTQIFLGNRETYRLQTGLANMQENARFAMEFLRRDISMAGYPRDTVLPIALTGTSNGAGTTSDTIAIRYQTTVDCLGNNIGAAFTTNVYSIGPNENGASSLLCNPGAGAAPVVDGIDNMQALYGEDTDNDGWPNRYVTSDTVGLDWSNVVAVRVALLLNTVQPVSRENDTTIYRLLDAPPLPAFDDQLRRRVFFSTMMMRNRTGQRP